MPEIAPAATLPPALLKAAPQHSPAGDPFTVYVASLGSPGSRRAMAACLHRIAALTLTAYGADPGPEPARTFPWASLRAEHTEMIRALIAQQTTTGPDGTPQPWSPAYRNKHLSALRGVLEAAWRLG